MQSCPTTITRPILLCGSCFQLASLSLPSPTYSLTPLLTHSPTRSSSLNLTLTLFPEVRLHCLELGSRYFLGWPSSKQLAIPGTEAQLYQLLLTYVNLLHKLQSLLKGQGETRKARKGATWALSERYSKARKFKRASWYRHGRRFEAISVSQLAIENQALQ